MLKSNALPIREDREHSLYGWSIEHTSYGGSFRVWLVSSFTDLDATKQENVLNPNQ